MKQTTEKITVSLPADTLQMADEKYKAFGFESRSDFITSQSYPTKSPWSWRKSTCFWRH